MKRLLSIIISLSVLISFSACSRSTEPMMAPSKATVYPMTPEEKAMAEAEIRYALSLLLDRNYIVEQIAQAGEQPASSFVAMGMADYDGQFYKNAGYGEAYDGYFNVNAYEENFMEAIRILQKYYDFNGTEFEDFPNLPYIYNTNNKHKATAEYVQAALKLIGVSTSLENQEWNTFLSTRKNGDYGIARNGWVADHTDPICFLDMWVTDAGTNDVQFGRGEHADLAIYSLDLRPYGMDIYVEKGTWAQTYDVLIAQIKQCGDPQVRYRLMHVAEDMLMATGCIVPLFFYTDLYMISPRVEGFYSNPLGYKYFHKTTVDGKGEGLSVCLSSEPDSIDPALNSTVDGATMLCHLFSGLAKWEQGADGDLHIVADCAETLPDPVENEDGSVTYTYRLKEDLKWSDGKALVAQDFVYAWNRAASEELGGDYGYLFESVRGYPDDLAVNAPDERTLEVTLTGPVSYWNELLAFPAFSPLREDVAQNESWATDPSTYIGNGPYKISTWEHDSVITITKNENYHDAQQVTMSSVRFYLSDDANNMLTNFQNGDWLLIDDVPANEISTLKAKYPEAFRVSGQIGTNYLCFNVNYHLLGVYE